jgi:hypothetical protein
MTKKHFVKKNLQDDLEAEMVIEFIERNEGLPERLQSLAKPPVEPSTLDPQARVREILKRSAVWWPWWEGRSK